MSEHVQNRFQTLEQDNMGFISPNQPYELPEAPNENFGLMATVDLGGSLMKPEFYHAQDENAEKPSDSRFQMLLVVDLEAEGGSRWAEGSDIPEGARIAIIDPKGMQTDENGRVTKGIDFIPRGKGLVIGREEPRSQSKFDIADSEDVSPKHLDIGVSSDGKVVIRDRGSRSGTIVGTGEMAREAVNGIGTEHEHHLVFKQYLGDTALSQSVVEPAFDAPKHTTGDELMAPEQVIPEADEDIEQTRDRAELGPEQIEALFQTTLASAYEAAVKVGGASDRVSYNLMDAYSKEFAEGLRNNYGSPENIAFFIRDFKSKMARQLQEFSAESDSDPEGIYTTLNNSGSLIQGALESARDVVQHEADQDKVKVIQRLGEEVSGNLGDGYASLRAIADTISQRCDNMMRQLSTSDTLIAIRDISTILSQINNTDIHQIVRARNEIDSAVTTIRNWYTKNYQGVEAS